MYRPCNFCRTPSKSRAGASRRAGSFVVAPLGAHTREYLCSVRYERGVHEARQKMRAHVRARNDVRNLMTLFEFRCN